MATNYKLKHLPSIHDNAWQPRSVSYATAILYIASDSQQFDNGLNSGTALVDNAIGY